MILNSIGELNKKLDLMNRFIGHNTSSVILPNGEEVSVGAQIFSEDKNTNNYNLIGNLIGENKHALFIENTNGGFITIDKTSNLAQTLSQFPF